MFNDLVTDKITKETAIVFARVANDWNLLAVSLSKGAATRFYCPTHERIFPRTVPCPECKEEE